MSSFLDSFITGMTFGILANNPFYGCCFGFGMSPMMYNRVDFGGFANPFPSIFSGMGYYSGGAAQLPPTTFANPGFPSVDFTQTGQFLWDSITNPDSDYNKQMREYYEQVNKQYEESKKDSKNNYANPFQSPFFMSQVNISPWQFYSDKKAENKNEKPEETEVSEPETKDSETNKISYDAQKLKDNWSKKQPQLTDKFYSRVVEISQKIKCNPEHLMAVMNLETKKTFSTSEKNPKSSATGLIQFTKGTAKDLGTTVKKLAKMTPEEQLDYVEKYLVKWKKDAGFNDSETLSSGDLYALVFQPANAKKDVLVRAGTEEYSKNKLLDVNNDNKITKVDLSEALKPFMA